MKATDYWGYSGHDDLRSGGVKLVLARTSKGDFRVWTKRVGNNPTIEVLLLHGGPGGPHEGFEACDSYFPAIGIEFEFECRSTSGYGQWAVFPTYQARVI